MAKHLGNKHTISALAGWGIAASLWAPLSGQQVSVPMQHNDNGRSGANLQETRLNASNVNNQNFGKLVFRIVDGNIYAQLLLVSQAKIGNRTANAVIVATENNTVYAFDAEDTNQASTTAKLWQTAAGALGPPIASTQLYNDIGAGGCSDITTQVGITSTPAIQIASQGPPQTGVVFVAAKSFQGGQYAYKLFALNLADGATLGQVSMGGVVKGVGHGSTGAGANQTIRFSPMLQLNRPALLLNGNVLYVMFGGHCDSGNYHGWVFAYDVSNPHALKLIDLLCITPNGTGPKDGRAGIWMSGQGPALDDAGNVYFVTGDGSNNAATDLGDSVVKVSLNAARKLQVTDWFAPQNLQNLEDNDLDLGSSGAVLAPNSHLLIAGSKQGILYLIDRDHMGKGATPALDSFQVTHDPDLRPNPPVYYNIHGTPVIWARANDMFVYVSGEEDHVRQFRLIPDPGGAGWKFESNTPFRTSPVTAPYPDYPTGVFGQANREPVWMPGGFLSLSASGTTDGTGILWVNMPLRANANHLVQRGVLRAFNASDVSQPELWDSEGTGNTSDSLGQFAKFNPPIVANGKVYVATFQQEAILANGVHVKAQGAGVDQPALAIYGLRQQP
jgi:hypothetical protein